MNTNMGLEIEAKIIEIFDEQQISEKFKKREFVVEKEENGFTEQIKFELVQDRVDIIDPYKVGDTIKISFNLKGRKYNDKYFTNIQAWRIESVAQGVPTPQQVIQENDLSDPPF